MNQNSLEKFSKQKTNIRSSSRTDQGVNARRHPVQFILERSVDKKILDLNTVKKGVNFYLRDSKEQIAIQQIYQVPFKFDVKYHSLQKEYVFYLDGNVGQMWENPLLLYKLSWCVQSPLETDRLRYSLSKMVGRHNFYCFTSPESFQTKFEMFERVIDSIDVQQLPNEFFPDVQSFRIVVKGKGFLKYQVRYLIGTAVLYAKHSICDKYLDFLLNPSGFFSEEEKKKLKRLKAEPQGLFLNNVQYDSSWLHSTIDDSLIEIVQKTNLQESTEEKIKQPILNNKEGSEIDLK